MALNKNIDTNRSVGNIKSVDTSNNIILLNTDKSANIVDEFYFVPGTVKATNSFIKKVERLIRSSNEYSKYIYYLSTSQTLNNDVVMANIDASMASTEFHHYPFTLFDIVSIMLEAQLAQDKKITSLSLAEDVLEEHYANIIGLAKLTTTNHQLAHAGEIFVPLTSVFGDVNAFINKYFDYISPELISTYNNLVSIQNADAYDNRGLTILNNTPKEEN